MTVDTEFVNKKSFFAKTICTFDHFFLMWIREFTGKKSMNNEDRLYVIKPGVKVLFESSFYVFRGQFHQHSTSSFYVRKLHAQLFCAYVLGLYFTGARLLAQKLHVECWWNWAQHGARRTAEVDRNFQLGVMVKLGVILLVKLNSVEEWLP